MHEDDLTLIGEHYGQGGAAASRPFGLLRADRRQHLYVIGAARTGKSTLLLNLLQQDLARGEGVALIDPDGRTAREALCLMPKKRIGQVCYFAPFDYAHPLAFNILQHEPDEAKRDAAVSGVLSVFKDRWNDSWGPRLEDILGNALAALMERPGMTLLQLPRFLTDQNFREKVALASSNSVVRSFWLDEFAGQGKRWQAEAVQPVLNKVRQFLRSSAMQRIFGQEQSAFYIPALIEGRGIFIANLGGIGSDTADLIGSLLLSRFAVAAQARGVPTAEDDVTGIIPAPVPDFYLSLEHCHRFAPKTLAALLSCPQHSRLNLSLCHRYGAQFSDERLQSAIQGTVGTMIAFRVGERDAELLARQFGKPMVPEEFTSRDNYEIVVRMLHEGRQQVPFIGKTYSLPWPEQPALRRMKVIERSRQTFGTPLEKLTVSTAMSPREQRLRMFEEIVRKRPTLRADSPTMMVQERIARAVSVRPQAASPALPHSATQSRTDRCSRQHRVRSPETDQRHFRRRFAKRFGRRFASLLVRYPRS